MKATIPTRTFTDAVGHAAAVASGKSPKPILECVALRADPKTGLILEATDLDVGIRIQVADAKVTKGGTLVIPASRLLSICREINEDETRIEEHDGGIRVKTGGSQFQVRGEVAEEWSTLPAFPEGSGIALPGALLQDMVRRTSFATAKEAGRFALQGVQFQAAGKKLEMVATDGRRLAKSTAALPKKVPADVQAIIGPKSLQLVERLVAATGADVHMALEDRQALFQVGSALVISRLIDGTFPSLDGVIPAKSEYAFESTAAEFAGGLRRASLLTTRDAMSVEFHLEPGSLVIRSRARDVGEAKVELPVSYEGSAQRVGFNPAYLQDALKVMEPGSKIRFEFSSPKSPGKLSDCDEYTYVVMPINLE